MRCIKILNFLLVCLQRVMALCYFKIPTSPTGCLSDELRNEMCIANKEGKCFILEWKLHPPDCFSYKDLIMFFFFKQIFKLKS